MAGGYGSKLDPKRKLTSNNSNEVLKEFSDPFRGVLFPGQSIELNKKETTDIKWNREFLIKSVNQEQAIFVSNNSKEIEKAINDLRLEIKKLIETTENLEQDVIQSTEQNIVDFNEYQLNFFQRIKMIIVNFRKNINEASNWLESFNHKKSKRNAFWNKAKSGGQKYMESSEHTVARSAN